MSQLFVAIKSSKAAFEAGAHDRVRGSWGLAFRGKAFLKFFIGQQTDGLEGRVVMGSRNSYNYKSDELALDVPDGLEGSVYKTRAICQFVMSKNIDHTLIVDVNSKVFVDRVWESNYEVADYAGKFNGTWGEVGPREIVGKNGVTEYVERCYPWAENGYFLSRRGAAEIADIFPEPNKFLLGNYDEYWVGQMLGPMAAAGDLLSMPIQTALTESI